jgi:anthranilate synthase component 1
MRTRLNRTRLPQRVDPVHAVQALASDPDLFWLDGGPDGWSFLGSGERVLPAAGDVLATLRRELAGPILEADDEAPPFRLGLVGWIGYEARGETTGVPVVDPPRRPAAFLRVRRALAIDPSGAAELLEIGDDPAWRAAIVERLAAPRDRSASAISSSAIFPSAISASAAPDGPVIWRDDETSYLAKIRACQEAIAAGESYQLCLTTTAEIPGRFDPVAVALALRASNPSHHAGLVRIAGTALVSSSPERFLEIGSDRVVRTRPIKGTRPRSIDPVHDRELAAELRASEKEQAENLMIVDLMRNDLARVCELGSVAVTRLLDVESYPQVHQLVSEIEGRLAPGRDAVDVLAACFPAGSMTGAPKRRATELLDAIEGGPRGVYSGVFGHLGFDGRADLAMVIRSVVIDDRGATVGSGGGITALSDPPAEYAEMRLKATAPLAALGVR